MKRKNNARLVIFVLVLSIYANIAVHVNLPSKVNTNEKEKIILKDTVKHSSDHPIDIPFIYGMRSSLIDLDPQNSWDRDSFDVIQQVCEGLFGYNLSDLEMPIIPYLAASNGIWSPDGLNYTVPLRIGVTFHDGASFNASAVKFTFDRLNYLMDYSMSVVQQLYEIYDPTTDTNRRIINRTEIIDTYSIKFVLNVPYGALDALLCFTGSYILSPISTPATTIIDTNTGDLVGTGPFVYDGYIPNVEVNFHAYTDYWQGKAEIDEMKFKIIKNNEQRQMALIKKEIHFLSNPDPDYFDAFSAIPYITFLDTGKTSEYISYLGMNNQQINVYFREAISYAIDYDYLINEVRDGQVERLKSPIPDGIRYANSTLDYPVLDLPHARTVIQSMGYGLGLDIYDDTDWENQAYNAPFATYNYTYNIGDSIKEDIFLLLKDSLAKIGIKVVGAGISWAEIIYMLFEIGGYHRNMLQLYWLSWVGDFNDPSSYLNNLFTNRTIAYNGAQVNDWQVQKWMEEALEEIDQLKRETLYDKIQKRLVEEVYPWVWGTVEKLYYACHVNLTGFQPNTLRIHYFYPCHWDPWEITPRSDSTFIVGLYQHPYDIDPHNVWDTALYPIIDQVYEGLFGYNYSDPEMRIIPLLAIGDGIWSPDGLNYTVSLRTGVTFHDGTTFNASAVKFSFDRLSYLSNHSGTLPGGTSKTILSELYEFKDRTPIIDRTEVVDPYTIRFVLNAQYAPIQELLCFSGSYILSPTSTPSMDYIDLYTGDLVGTGPFVYDGYIPDIEVNFHAYNNYWREKAEIEYMKFKIYNDNEEGCVALLTREVDFIDGMQPEWVDIYHSYPNITILDEGKTGSIFSFLGMNNLQINVIFREAISYAIDYDYIVDDIYEGSVSRLKSPIPEGLRYSNSTFNYPVLDLPYARTLIQSLGYGIGFDIYDDNEWENQARNAPFATFNYTYNFGNKIRESILPLLQDNLAKIGIRVTDAGGTLAEYYLKLLDIPPYHKNMLQLFWLSWGPDFNDPSNFLDSLFLNTSEYNFAQMNDMQVSKWLEDALIETNPTQRERLYDKIQQRLVEEIYPWAWGTVNKLYTAYHQDLAGYQQNALERLYFYNCKWNRKYPRSFELVTDARSPDLDGNFYINWTASDGAINYSVYQHTSYITIINGSLTPLAVEITGLSLALSDYLPGTYYFIVVALNEYGETLSNCIKVVVSLTAPGAFILLSTAGNPDTDGFFDLVWSSSSNANNYSVYQYDEYITVINESLTLLANEITDLTIPLSGYTTGIYFFIVVAYNEYGNTLSNCIKIDVQNPIVDSLTILIPDNTTSWEKGSDHYIYWTSTGAISDVKIDLYNDDIFVMELVASTSNDGEYYWTLSSTLVDSTQYQIRITDVSSPSTFGYSDYFEIKSSAPTRSRIPGYNLFIIISVICVISGILLKNKRKKY